MSPVQAVSYTEDYWRDADVLTKRFICASYGETPDWCSELPGEVEVPKSIAGVLEARGKAEAERRAAAKAAAEVIAARTELAKRVKSGRAGRGDVEKLVEQAKAGEPEAMELIAWMYARGLSPERKDEDELNELAYIWYGKAYLAGVREVKANMDEIWPTLSETQQQRIVAFFDKKS